MKRTLSLILALAMIMSLFTTVSFAADGTYGSPYDKNMLTGDTVAYLKDVLADGTLTSKYPPESDSTKYYWSSQNTSKATVVETTGKVTVVEAGDVTFKLIAAVKGDSDSYDYYTDVLNVTIINANKADYDLTVNKTELKLAVGETGSVTPAFAKKSSAADAVPAAVPGYLAYTYSSDKPAVATVNASGVIEAKAAGTAKITCTATYAGATYTKVVTVKVTSLDIAKDITNGSTTEGAYAAATLKSLVESQVRAATGSTSYTVSTLTLKTPASFGNFTVYLDSIADSKKAAVSTTYSNFAQKLIVVPTAGYVSNTLTLDYEANGGYSGKITFTSTYAKAVEVKQEAPFFNEEFFVDSITGIKKLVLGKKTTPSGVADYYEAPDGVKVAPGGKTSNWSETYTGYDSDGAAHLVTVTFEPVEYDILAYAEEDVAPFNFEAFANFAELVEETQENHYSISVDHVEFPTVSNGSKWALEKGGKTIKSSDEFTASNMSALYLDVATAGSYDIPFRVHYDYKATKSSSWTTNANSYYQGLIRVYAALDGDIQYEVTYGETVNFDSADFSALYKKLTSSKKVLETVTINELPVYGTLYRNNKVSNSYTVDEEDVYYFDPSTANSAYDLDKLLYWASKASTEEYSVYIPVTMDGTGGTEEAVVEIVINGALPFKDIAKGSTFYDYIQYAYNNGIMGGKSETNFDAKSSITRAQLVTTLYRMAGSPTTYNGKVLPYTDTKYLSAEFSNALKWATAKGIATGYGDTFNPNSAVTRQAMVTILYRYAKTEGFGVGVTSVNNLGYFTDGAKVSTSMRDAMNWAVDYGLISGNGAKLNPGGSTTRGAAAKILSNFHALYIG